MEQKGSRRLAPRKRGREKWGAASGAGGRSGGVSKEAAVAVGPGIPGYAVRGEIRLSSGDGVIPG